MMKPEIIVFKGDIISISDNLRGQEVDDSFVSLSSLREFLETRHIEVETRPGGNQNRINMGRGAMCREILQWLQQEDDQQEVEALTDIKASERK